MHWIRELFAYRMDLVHISPVDTQTNSPLP